MNQQTITLISIGASVGANCQPCLEFHVGKARELGIDEASIQKAVETAQAVRTGAAFKMDQYARSLTKSAMPAASSGGCNCGCESGCC